MASPVVNAAIAETIVISYRDIKNKSNVDNPIPHFPLPSQYASVVIIYGALSFFPEQGQGLAALIGWGFVLATVLNLYSPGGSVKLATVNSTAPTTGVTP
jgi:hypothetical protein